MPKYIVQNPRNINPEIRIIHGKFNEVEYEWFAGDELEPPEGMTATDIQWLVTNGLIVPEGDVTLPIPEPEPEPEPEPQPAEEEIDG